MAEIEHDTGFLSIGEVLNLLVEEFPDVTISKIRFLESQGLITPERTSSGYRKFYQEDIDLLRVILTEQKQNFLPLRVIRNRLKTGEIDPTGEHLKFLDQDMPTETPPDGMRRPQLPDDVEEVDSDDPAVDAVPDTDPPIRPGQQVSQQEFRELAGISEEELTQLEEFGVLHRGSDQTYDLEALRVAVPAAKFLRHGIDARHLRLFRTTAEREAALFEQLVQPRFRQRNPEATAQAVGELRELDKLGSQLRDAMMSQLLARHLND